jgi:hypothetical protein
VYYSGLSGRVRTVYLLSLCVVSLLFQTFVYTIHFTILSFLSACFVSLSSMRISYRWQGKDLIKYIISIFLYMITRGSDYRRGLEWRLDLLTT